MKKISFLFFFLCFVILVIFLFSLIGRLVSLPSDIGLGMGVGLLILLVCGGAVYMDKIKNILPIFLLLFLGGCTRIEPGEVGIRVNLAGSNRGAEEIPLVTGWVLYNPLTEKIYEFPTYQQNTVWTADSVPESPTDESITFNSSEGSAVNVDVALSYSLDANKVPHLFVHYRSDIHSITHKYVRNEVRDIFTNLGGQYTTMEIMSTKRQEFLSNAKSELIKRLADKGFIVELLGIMGKPRIDPKIEAQINNAIAQTQATIAAQNRVAQIEAEAQQKIAEAEGNKQSKIKEAEGQGAYNLVVAEETAKANRVLAQSLTPELLEWKAIEKWSGTVPTYTGTGAVPFVNLGESK